MEVNHRIRLQYIMSYFLTERNWEKYAIKRYEVTVSAEVFLGWEADVQSEFLIRDITCVHEIHAVCLQDNILRFHAFKQHSRPNLIFYSMLLLLLYYNIKKIHFLGGQVVYTVLIQITRFTENTTVTFSTLTNQFGG